MFVLKRTYDQLMRAFVRSVEERELLIKEFKKLRRQWNELVERINEKGGEEFLQDAKIINASVSPFDEDDITRLLQLCHPDKHDGKTLAVEMTQKLLAFRSKEKG